MEVLPPDTFEPILGGSIIDKTVFCLGESHGMFLNYECSSWYNEVSDFSISIG